MLEAEPYWLEQSEEDVPTGDDWLSGDEAAVLLGLRFAKRRSDWRLGRWTAKCAVAAYLKLPTAPALLGDIEIRALPSGAPQIIIISDRAAPAAISISHRDGIGMCAVAAPATAIGCDLEIAEAHSAAFMCDYFTEEEEMEIAEAPASRRPLLVAVLWSAKESALKVLCRGLRLDTRAVSVRLGDWDSGPDRWYPLQVRHLPGTVFHGWWQTTGSVVRTLVASPQPGIPRLLSLPGCELASASVARVTRSSLLTTS